MDPILLWSLNGERFAGDTPHEESPTVAWLKGLSSPRAIVPDVLCLQDVRVSMLQHLNPLPYFSFVPMTRHIFWGWRELLGICIASRWPLSEIDVHHTWGDGTVHDLQGVGEDQKRIQPHELADRLVLQTQNRVAIACSVHRPGDPTPTRVATHHGLWVRDGIPTQQQWTSTASVCAFLTAQGRKYGGLVYAADYNPDKDGCVLDMYTQSGGRDALPPEIATTLAPHHPAAHLGIRSDCIMSWPDAHGNYPYAIRNVHLDTSPGSDHAMLRCEVKNLSSPPSRK
jgi:hypothetical protein